MSEKSCGNVIITGGATGIGAACVRLFARRGFNVIVGYNSSREAAAALVRDIRKNKGCAFAVKADVSRPGEALKLVSACLKHFGDPDILVNNAGVALPQKLITETTDEEFRRVMDVNVFGTFACSREVLPYLIRNHSGSIVNVSSIWGRVGGSCEVPYSASKGAVISFTKALAKEVGPSGIRVNCVAPGVINTKMNGALDKATMKMLSDEAALCRIGEPEEVAESVFFLALGGASFVTGAVLDVNGGM